MASCSLARPLILTRIEGPGAVPSLAAQPGLTVSQESCRHVSNPDGRKGVTSSAPAHARYSPATSGAATLYVQDHPVEIRIGDDRSISVIFGRPDLGRLEFTAADVTRWCAETSLLMRVTFGLAADDEVRVRAPMLVDRRGTAMAVVRRVTRAGSELVLAIAATSADLANDRHLSALDASLDEIRSLVVALENAAGVAKSPRDAS